MHKIYTIESYIYTHTHIYMCIYIHIHIHSKYCNYYYFMPRKKNYWIFVVEILFNMCQWWKYVDKKYNNLLIVILSEKKMFMKTV